ncbi:MAG: RNA polymerase factor sigma-54 [candidate division Zixibacteria bacterium]|nr:RNA polymerase factor sigma-54 [candidate division Zixibacteria bacterium]
MKLELQMKLKQVLAPQLIQSLRLLQMPMLRLEQVIRQELSTNPLLEEVEPTEETANVSDNQEETQVDPQLDKINWEDYVSAENEIPFREERDKGEKRWERTPVLEKTLYDHLIEQLHFSKLDKEEVKIGEYIIGNIDESGYLVCSTEEIASSLDVSPEKVSKVLSIIQTFDPSGVGAKDLRESLLIQLKEKGFEDTLAYRIVRDHINELERKSLSQLSRLLGISFEEVQKAMDFIKTLNPSPATGKFTRAATPVVPDLIVDKIGDEFVVYHNDKNMPRLRINPAYKDLLRRDKGKSSETKNYIKGKLEQAKWLLNSINQRRSTMIRVMEMIVEEQKDFFENGPSFLKPLTMESIAERVGMHVATVSRVSNSKYVQTPRGVFEIRYFFNTGVSKENGEELSKRNVKRIIEEHIKKENPARPLSDQELFNLLKKDGINIARRTVSKYREELKILPARFRKRIVKENSNSSPEGVVITPSSDSTRTTAP